MHEIPDSLSPFSLHVSVFARVAPSFGRSLAHSLARRFASHLRSLSPACCPAGSSRRAVPADVARGGLKRYRERARFLTRIQSKICRLSIVASVRQQCSKNALLANWRCALISREINLLSWRSPRIDTMRRRVARELLAGFLALRSGGLSSLTKVWNRRESIGGLSNSRRSLGTTFPNIGFAVRDRAMLARKRLYELSWLYQVCVYRIRYVLFLTFLSLVWNFFIPVSRLDDSDRKRLHSIRTR